MSSRGGIKKKIVGEGVVALGGNEFETGYIEVPANSFVTKGTVLSRATDGKFVRATASADIIAVNSIDIVNDTDSAQQMSFRALINGPVREDLLRLNGGVLNAADRDNLRRVGIVPILVIDISRTE
jgi:hypothetical protein